MEDIISLRHSNIIHALFLLCTGVVGVAGLSKKQDRSINNPLTATIAIDMFAKRMRTHKDNDKDKKESVP